MRRYGCGKCECKRSEVDGGHGEVGRGGGGVVGEVGAVGGKAHEVGLGSCGGESGRKRRGSCGGEAHVVNGLGEFGDARQRGVKVHDSVSVLK